MPKPFPRNGNRFRNRRSIRQCVQKTEQIAEILRAAIGQIAISRLCRFDGYRGQRPRSRIVTDADHRYRLPYQADAFIKLIPRLLSETRKALWRNAWFQGSAPRRPAPPAYGKTGRAPRASQGERLRTSMRPHGWTRRHRQRTCIPPEKDTGRGAATLAAPSLSCNGGRPITIFRTRPPDQRKTC